MIQRFVTGMVLTCSLLARILIAADAPAPGIWEPKHGDVLVFVGDQVTEQSLYTQYLDNFLLTRFPGRDIRVMNAGVDGSRVRDALQRLASDVAVHKPTHVAVLLGLNDAGNQPFREDLFQTYRQDFVELDRRIRELHATPIYLSPTMFDARSARQHAKIDKIAGREFFNATLAYYGVWLREFANEAPAAFIDLHGPLTRLTHEARFKQPAFTFLQDGTNPDPSGHLVIAASLLDQLGLAKPLSSIEISRQDNILTATADGGHVLNLHLAGLQSLTFDWLAEALPWRVSNDTASAEELLNLAERFNRETLQIRGLAAGNYELLIENRLIGRFTDEEFADGVALHRLVTPQVEQAEQISQRNRERNETAIRPAREAWELFQTQERWRAQLAMKPEDAALQEKLTVAEIKVREAGAKLAEFAESAGAMLAELQELSQPVPRQFVIRPVQTAQVQGRVLIGGVPIPGALVELHGLRGLAAVGTTDAMGSFDLTSRFPDGIPSGEAWLVVLAKMVLPPFVSVEKSGHRVMLRSGINEIELHFEDTPAGRYSISNLRFEISENHFVR